MGELMKNLQYSRVGNVRKKVIFKENQANQQQDSGSIENCMSTQNSTIINNLK